MFIPMPIAEDIAGVAVLILRVVVEVLKRFEEKENLFAVFPIGATMQDGGKRKRSGGVSLPSLSKKNLSFSLSLYKYSNSLLFYFCR